MKLVFMGTPELARSVLGQLLDDFPFCAVVSQPDRPCGRGQTIRPTPVKTLALERGIAVFQPHRARDKGFVDEIRQIGPDLIAVVAYGSLLSEGLIRIPKLGCINLHSSLLPKYRGAAPVQWALINGETRTGWTTFYIDRGMDSGDIILQNETGIGPEEDAVQLTARMLPMGVALMKETLRRVLAGNASRSPQNHTEVSFAPTLKKTDGLVDWRMPARAIADRVRGLVSWPVAYTYLPWKSRSLEFRIFQARTVPGAAAAPPGIVVGDIEDGLAVGTGDGSLLIREVQLEGGRRMGVQEFLRGRRIPSGTRLGRD